MVIGLSKKGPETKVLETKDLKTLETKEKSSLLKRIERSAASRDRVTERLLSELISPKRTARRFVEDACKLAGYKPPKEKEPLAPFVYWLQKKVCKFNEKDYKNGCDGKLGPITFTALLNAIPKLKIYDRNYRGEKFKKERQDLAKKEGLPNQKLNAEKSADKKETPTQLPEAQKTTPNKTVTAGDSLTVQYARYFYKGTGKYREYRNRVFKGGQSIRWMRRKLERNPERLRNSKTLVLGGGANDIYYRSPGWIVAEARKIIDLARSINPNIRIILLKLHGDGCNYWKRRPQQTKNKLLALNREFDSLASEYSNIKTINVRDEIRDAKEHGKRLLSRDGLHYNRKGSQAIAAKLRDEVETGTSKPLREYV